MDSNKGTSVFASLDKWSILLYLLMIVAGWLSIYGASYDFDQISVFDLSGRTGMQLVWIGTALLFALVILLIDRHYIETYAYIYYALMLLLLCVTIFVAPDIKGSRSWLVFGPFRLQPAEFAKVTTALALSRFLSSYNFKLKGLKNYFLTILIIVIPMIMILLQKETGSALVFLGFFIVLYREGMSGKILFSGGCAALLFIIAVKFPQEILGNTHLGNLIDLVIIFIITTVIVLKNQVKNTHIRWLGAITGITLAIGAVIYYFIPFDLVFLLDILIIIIALFLIYNALSYRSRNYFFTALFALSALLFVHSVEYAFNEILEPHQQIRIRVTLGLENDPSGAGYNVNQSKIAIGSGGLYGKGFLNGTQTKLKYVPEQDTDFIFCTVGEEHGFIGTMAVLAVFLALITRILFLAESHRRSPFVRIYGYCVVSVLMMHVGINIGMVIGIMPVIGIPLPFFSYGGSSLWGFTILLFIFLKLDTSVKE
ncbi:MAG: rod shape-determining protein RodA [Bacteroidales bacterium]|nr:rod shape-determining protein RodA [Bacteroidales bacterium]